MKDEFQSASENERQKMIQLFNQFGVQHYTFTNAKGYDRVDGHYTGKTGNEYVFEVKTRTNDSNAFNYNTAIDKSKVEYVINESKKSAHQPLLFFFFESGDCWIQKLDTTTYYSSFPAKAKATTVDGNQTKVIKDFVGFNIDPNKLITLQ
jgi:hypothetical protein